MRHIAIIGSGPAGYYTAEAAQKQWGEEVRVDIFDLLPVPYGLIRTGVAPDHQSIKGVSRRYESTALLDNVFGSAAFVGWYNGHPQFAKLNPDLSGQTAVVIGNGNVALDVARILAKTQGEFSGSDIVAHALHALQKSRIERVVILGRRGPHQIAMTPKELGELAHLERACPRVDPADLPDPTEDLFLEPGQRKSVEHLRGFAAIPEAFRSDKPVEIDFDFFASPRAILGDGTVKGIEVECTVLDSNGRASGTGTVYTIPCGLVVTCIGYKTSPIPGVPFEESAGRFANDEGRILPGLYCVGWARRGPSGTIGTNRPDGFAVVEKIAEDIGVGADKPGRPGFDALAAERKLDVVTFRDWQKIEQAEQARAREGAPREKFVDVAEMIKARGD